MIHTFFLPNRKWSRQVGWFKKKQTNKQVKSGGLLSFIDLLQYQYVLSMLFDIKKENCCSMTENLHRQNCYCFKTTQVYLPLKKWRKSHSALMKFHFTVTGKIFQWMYNNYILGQVYNVNCSIFPVTWCNIER